MPEYMHGADDHKEIAKEAKQNRLEIDPKEYRE